MNALFRGLCELQIDDMPVESLTHDYSELIRELGIPEESRSFFLMGYVAGSARSRLNATSLAISNRALNGDEIEVFSEVMGRRMNDILEKILDQEIENFANEEIMIEAPRPEVSGEYEETFDEEEITEVPLKTVATIGEPEVEEEKFSFKISGRKKNASIILGIPVHT